MLRLPISPRPHVASPLFRILFLLGSLPNAAGVLVNRTIDDEYGDSVTGVKPVYGPTGSDPDDDWKQGLGCVSPCVFSPYTVIDVSQVSNGTWHDSTYRAEHGEPRTITAAFEGTAVYVYFIVPNHNVLTPTFVSLTFAIDGALHGQYVHTPDSSATIMYRVLVFHTTDLAGAIHTIQVAASGTNDSLLLFDNMVYTAEEADPTQTMSSSPGTPTVTGSASSSTPRVTGSTSSSTSSTSSTPVAAIAGGVAGGVAALIFLVVLLCFCRPSRRTPSHTDRIHPKCWMRKLPRRRHRSASPPAFNVNETRTPWASTVVHPYPVIRPVGPVCPPIIPGGETEGAEEKAQAHHDAAMLPHDTSLGSPSGAYRSTSSSRAGGVVTQAGSILHDQVAVLQEEVARLRNAEMEMRQLFLAAPPRYEDAES
ncbi:hypothetical protein K466DRAFT_605245 [Polyporus arcularius HHB13444]|uniref:Uncharacterized protein n=1 Tax=Polyporus arcularius HHB13444 TaxID=1314778 RepID=A0A5C3NUT4_9APHY|nr:hypothetical protein K466DRAFT_605245 [Polyporus arcularius HHB13444]